MDVVRHGRPSKAFLATLRKVTKADFERLVRATLEAAIAGEVDVFISFPYNFKYPRDFPKGLVHEEEGGTDIRKIKVRRLMKWLNDHGHTDMTMEDVRRQKITFKQGENYFGNMLDFNQALDDNSFIPETNEERV